MKILVVDDAEVNRRLLCSVLERSGYTGVVPAGSAAEAFAAVDFDNADPQSPCELDLVLMDLIMPDMDGVEACRQLKSNPRLRDIPVIMITAAVGIEGLEESFEAGAIDYVKKPFTNIELLARVRSVVTLKREIDRRRRRETELLEARRQLEEANRELRRLSVEDALTKISNRRVFDQTIRQEWKRAAREATPLSVALVDVDYFKNFNDTYGHPAGDECLRRVAAALKETVRRPADLVARYGGEEFAVVLANTEPEGAAYMGERLRAAVEALNIPHGESATSDHVTISVGCASVYPWPHGDLLSLIELADQALYDAKRAGRNHVEARVAPWHEGVAKA